MIWLFGIAGVAVVGTLAFLSKMENDARQAYYQSSQDLSDAYESCQRSMESMLTNQRISYDYHANIKLHHASVQLGANIHQQFKKQRSMVRMIAAKRTELFEQREVLQAQLKASTAEQKASIKAKLDGVKKDLDLVHQELQVLKQEKEALYQRRKQVNQRTNELKMHIKNCCGKQGAAWYARNYDSMTKLTQRQKGRSLIDSHTMRINQAHRNNVIKPVIAKGFLFEIKW